MGTPGKITQEIVKRLVDDLVLVDEGDIEQAVLMLLEIEKTLVEGAGAAGLAALVRYPERFKGKRVGLVLCGGNIDPLLLAAIIERGMVRSGRLARIKVSARDVPGVLARITATVADAGANIEEVHHQRAFTMLAAQNVEIELVLQTRGKTHVDEVLATVAHGGHAGRSDLRACSYRPQGFAPCTGTVAARIAQVLSIWSPPCLTTTPRTPLQHALGTTPVENVVHAHARGAARGWRHHDVLAGIHCRDNGLIAPALACHPTAPHSGAFFRPATTPIPV